MTVAFCEIVYFLYSILVGEQTLNMNSIHHGSDGLESFKNKGQTYCDTVPLKGQFTRNYSTVQYSCKNAKTMAKFPALGKNLWS